MNRLAFAMLCAVVFSLPWEKSVVVPGLGTLTRLLGALALASGLAAAGFRRELRRPNLALAAMLAFIAWVALTWFWSLDPAATAARTLTYMQLAALVWLIWDVCREEAQANRLLEMYVWGSAVASVATIARYAIREQTYYRRYAAPGFDPNDLAITVALAIPIALAVSAHAKPARAWLARLSAALCVAAILLTASRTGMIAAAVGLLYLAFTWRGSRWDHRVCSVLLAAMLPVGMLWLAPKASRQRLATTRTELTTGTLHKRTQIWKTGLKALKQRPIIGVGAGAYPDAVKPWLGVPGVPGHEYVAHNTFLSVLVETGAIGALLYAVLLVVTTLYVWALPGAQRGMWATTLLIWAIGAFMLTWEHRKPGWLLLGLIMVHWARSFDRQRPASVPEWP